MIQYKSWFVVLALMFAFSMPTLAQTQVVRMLEKGKTDTATIILDNGINYLDCSSGNLVWLDLTKATNLRSVDCSDNLLDSIDIRMLTQLDELVCCNNNLKALDLSQNTGLRYLDCSSNQLESLDVTDNANLQVLNCSDNNLNSIYSTQNECLRSFWASNNNLSEADLFNNYDLKSLNLAGNNLCALSFNPNSGIQDLWVEDNELTDLRLLNINSLHSLNASNNALKSIVWQKALPEQTIYMIDCANNHLPYSSFITSGKVSNYFGGLQSDVYSGFDGLMMNERVDISALATNASGERNATVTAFNAQTDAELEKGSNKDYQYQIGQLRFWKEFENVYLVLTNSKYKSLEIHTTPFAVEDPEGINDESLILPTLDVTPGKGELTIRGNGVREIFVTTLSGQVLCNRQADLTNTIRISLPEGIYIVNGQKIKVN